MQPLCWSEHVYVEWGDAAFFSYFPSICSSILHEFKHEQRIFSCIKHYLHYLHYLLIYCIRCGLNRLYKVHLKYCFHQYICDSKEKNLNQNNVLITEYKKGFCIYLFHIGSLWKNTIKQYTDQWLSLCNLKLYIVILLLSY